MKVKYYLPRPVEAQVVVDAKAGEVVIEPTFVKGVACSPVGYVEVTGAAGRCRRYCMEVNGRTGAMVLRELQSSTAAYDKKEESES